MAGLRRADVVGILIFLAAWGGSTAYLGISGGDWVFPIASLGIFGGALSLIAWAATRGSDAQPIPVARPALESTALLVFLALYAVVFLGWGLSAAREAVPAGREQEVFILALKLVVHVALPALLLVALGAKLAPLFQGGLRGRKFWRTFVIMSMLILALLAVVSPSLRNIQALNPSPMLLLWIAPVSFIWIAVEAGLCEEFLFRAVLQTRLTAWFKSAWAGVIVTSILFGLAHAPGLYLRGGPGVDGWSTDPLQVAAFTIATLSPISLLFGVLYARTKSLLLVVLLHGMVDVLPNLSDFIRMWT